MSFRIGKICYRIADRIVECLVCRFTSRYFSSDIGCILCDICFVLCDVGCILCDVSFVLRDIGCILCNVSFVLCDIGCILCNVSFILRDIGCILCNVSFILRDIRCILRNVSFVLRDIRCILCDVSRIRIYLSLNIFESFCVLRYFLSRFNEAVFALCHNISTRINATCYSRISADRHRACYSRITASRIGYECAARNAEAALRFDITVLCVHNDRRVRRITRHCVEERFACADIREAEGTFAARLYFETVRCRYFAVVGNIKRTARYRKTTPDRYAFIVHFYVVSAIGFLTELCTTVRLHFARLCIHTKRIFTLIVRREEHFVFTDVTDRHFAFTGCSIYNKVIRHFRFGDICISFDTCRFVLECYDIACIICDSFRIHFDLLCRFYKAHTVCHNISTCIDTARYCRITAYAEAARYCRARCICYKCAVTYADMLRLDTARLCIDTYHVVTVCIRTVEHRIACDIFDRDLTVTKCRKRRFAFRSYDILRISCHFGQVDHTAVSTVHPVIQDTFLACNDEVAIFSADRTAFAIHICRSTYRDTVNSRHLIVANPALCFEALRFFL